MASPLMKRGRGGGGFSLVPLSTVGIKKRMCLEVKVEGGGGGGGGGEGEGEGVGGRGGGGRISIQHIVSSTLLFTPGLNI